MGWGGGTTQAQRGEIEAGQGWRMDTQPQGSQCCLEPLHFLWSYLGRLPSLHCPALRRCRLGAGRRKFYQEERRKREKGKRLSFLLRKKGGEEKEILGMVCFQHWPDTTLRWNFKSERAGNQHGWGLPKCPAISGWGRGHSERFFLLPTNTQQRRLIQIPVHPWPNPTLPQSLPAAQPECGGQGSEHL